VIFLGLSFFFVKKYLLVSDKDRVMKTMRLAENFLERKDHVSFMKQISMEYLDDYGYTWATLFFVVKNTLNRYENISISLSQVNIEIEENTASVDFLATVEAKPLSGESFADMGRFTLKMKKEGSRWKIVWSGENPYSFY